MNFKMITMAALMTAGGFAQATVTINQPGPKLDLSFLQASPVDLLDSSDNTKPMPQACTDAAITDDQKTKIKEAMFNNKRDNVQLEANLKVAFMNYGHTVMDSASDIAAAQTASAAIVEAAHKMAESHLALGNDVLYNIVTPEQRAKTFECMLALHKAHRKGNK